MASEVSICNLALAHLGDSATVLSIDPPEGSAQAEHCARFYPIARDALLEMHTWGFATRRATLAEVTNSWPEWDYAYAVPSNAVNLIAVLSSDATDDYVESVPSSTVGPFSPKPFANETTEDGTQVILTDQESAVLRYTTIVEDTTKFSPLFVVTLSWHLASFLAGPIIKGDAGAAEAKRCAAMAMQYLSQAKQSDAGQRRVPVSHEPEFLRARNSLPDPYSFYK
jgi:hypothetical protein